MLKESYGLGWSTQDTGVRSFAAENLNGVNYVFDLDSSGSVKSSTGSGWVTQDTGVRSFAAENLQGVNYVFDLNSSGTLKESRGRAGSRRTPASGRSTSGTSMASTTSST